MRSRYSQYSIRSRFLFAALFGFAALAPADVFAQSALYVSVQSGASTSFSGSYSKCTDHTESGSATLTTSGPITISYSPDLSISTEDCKDWTGSVGVDVGSAPSPGSSATATVTADYEYTYGTGWPTEYETESGTESEDVTVYSINVEIPDSIGVPITGAGNATATGYPDGGSYEWSSSSSQITLSDTDQQTVSIEVTDPSMTSADIKVVYTIEGLTYEDYGTVVPGECERVEGAQTFGPVAVNVSVDPDNDAPDSDGYCSYTVADAAFEMQMQGAPQNKSAAVAQVALSFEKHVDSGAIRSATMNWSGTQDIGTFGVIEADLTAFSLSIDDSGYLSGSSTMTAKLTADAPFLNGFVVLKQGVSGSITFAYGGSDWAGTFDFGGVTNINVDLVKNGTILAQVTNGSLTSDGSFTGTLSASGQPQFVSNGFTLTLGSLSLGVEFGLEDGLSLTSGSGEVTVSDIQNVTGTITLSLAFSSGNVSATVSASEIQAFTMTLQEVSLTVEMTETMDLTRASGTLKAKHDKFDVAFAVDEFTVEGGELTVFKGSGNVKFEKFSFALRVVDYDGAKLAITGDVGLDAIDAWVLVEDFTISTGGTVSVGRIAAEYSKGPVTTAIDARFGTSRFTGSFTGDFTAVSVSGSIDVGSMDSFTFCSLDLAVGRDIPLGNSGIKLTEISGGIGYNYDKIGGAPAEGTYAIKFGLKLADVANIVELGGETTVQLTSSTVVIALDGTIQATRNTAYFNGDVSVSYTLPGQSIAGSLSATLTVPTSGAVLEIENASVNFNIGNRRWSATGNGTGSFLRTLDFSGNGSVRGYLSGGSMTGSVSGRASGTFTDTATYPEGFDSTTYSTANSTDDWGGFGFYGTYRLNVNSTVSASISDSGLSGSISVNVNASGRMDIKVPWHLIRLGNMGASGTMTVSRTSGSHRLRGDLTFRYGSRSGDVSVDLAV